MFFGKPVVVTNCDEIARWVNECNSGLVVEDTAEGIAVEELLRMMEEIGAAI